MVKAHLRGWQKDREKKKERKEMKKKKKRKMVWKRNWEQLREITLYGRTIL